VRDGDLCLADSRLLNTDLYRLPTSLTPTSHCNTNDTISISIQDSKTSPIRLLQRNILCRLDSISVTQPNSVKALKEQRCWLCWNYRKSTPEKKSGYVHTEDPGRVSLGTA